MSLSEVEGQTNHIHSAQRHFFMQCVLIFFTVACAPAATQTPVPQILDVYATPAAQPWLVDVFTCVPPGTAIRVADSPAEADLSLRIGEPDVLAKPAYQIATEEVMVVTHRQSPVQNLSVEEVRALFAGQTDLPVQVWVYAEGEDVQRVFEQAVMQGRSVTSFARLAASPQQMSDVLINEANTLGILPTRWKAGDARFVYTIPDVPVLALLEQEPQGAIQAMIACLQE